MKLNKSYRRVMEGGRFRDLDSIARRNKWHSLLIASLSFSLLFVLLMCAVVFGEEYTPDEIVSAIYVAEGGINATWLYGIRSMPYSSPQEARQICKNTVVNTYKRWLKAGKPKLFISFLADRYCPVSADPKGHDNWIHNVNYFLTKNSEVSNVSI